MNLRRVDIRKNLSDFHPRQTMLKEGSLADLTDQFLILMYAIAALSQHSAFSKSSAASGHCFKASSNRAHSSLISFPGRRKAIVTPLWTRRDSRWWSGEWDLLFQFAHFDVTSSETDETSLIVNQVFFFLRDALLVELHCRVRIATERWTVPWSKISSRESLTWIPVVQRGTPRCTESDRDHRLSPGSSLLRIAYNLDASEEKKSEIRRRRSENLSHSTLPEDIHIWETVLERDRTRRTERRNEPRQDSCLPRAKNGEMLRGKKLRSVELWFLPRPWPCQDVQSLERLWSLGEESSFELVSSIGISPTVIDVQRIQQSRGEFIPFATIV